MKNKKIFIILLLLLAITGSILGINRLVNLNNNKSNNKIEEKSNLKTIGKKESDKNIVKNSSDSSTSKKDLYTEKTKRDKEESKKSHYIDNINKKSNDNIQKEKQFIKVREVIEKLNSSQKKVEHSSKNKFITSKENSVAADENKINHTKIEKINQDKKNSDSEIDSNNVSEKNTNENSKQETNKDIKDTNSIDNKNTSEPIEDSKKKNPINNKDNFKDDEDLTNIKEPEKYDDKFTVLDLNLNSDYQLVYSEDTNNILPANVFIGFKYTGENDNKLHKVNWISEHLDKINNKVPGRYSVIVEVLDTITINGIEYKDIKFHIDIIVKDAFNSYLVENDINSKTDNSQIRVILELKSDSILEEANKQGRNFNSLSDQFISNKRDDLKKEQEKLISELKAKNIIFKDNSTTNYDTLLNGVAGIVNQKDIETIQKNNLVRNIYYSQEFERPLLKSQQDIIGAKHAWSQLKYKGEGTLIAVIDSGIDVNHKDLTIDKEALNKIKYNKDKINKFIEANKLKGKYFSDKVPYGYNYYDFSNNLLDSYGNMHGMHVSGIVGANNKSQNIYGVAPNSQILAMKVFSDDLQYPTTFTDVWLKALDDAIKLGADSINMSLGSPSGFTIDNNQNHPEIKLFDKARKAGIVITVAVGNEANIVNGNPFNVKSIKENYDTGLVANPAINENSFAVASMENTVKYINSISWNLMGRQYNDNVNLFIPNGIKDDITAETIDLKEGKEFDNKNEKNQHHNDHSDDEDLDEDEVVDEKNLPKVENKIVLIKWPETDARKEIFEDTLNNIALRKPKAILLARPDDKIKGRLILQGEAGRKVYGIISNKTYKKISGLELIKLPGVDNRLTINVIQKEVKNPLAGKLSLFSTWGPTPDLRIKPEITAVGGNISSTIENDNYRNMSGTSMAAPQVSGAVAIMKQYLSDIKYEYTNSADLIKLILMNTAEPIKNSDDTLYFVRQQGAGALNLEKALKTKAYVSVTGDNDSSIDGKLELKQLSESKFEFTLNITNMTNERLEYKPEIISIKEKIEKGYRTEKPEYLKGQLNSKDTIVILPKQTKEIKYSYDFSISNLDKNNYIEGFIKLTSLHDNINLSLPFLGFYGDWSSQDAIDAFGVNEYNKGPKSAQFFINEKLKSGSSMFISTSRINLPIIDNKVFFSPGSEYASKIGVRIAPLRNMEEIEYSILDGETKKTLKVIGKSKNVRKLNRLHVNNTFRIMPDSFWDGEINNKPAQANKLYIYQLKVKLNNIGIGTNSEQIYQYPIMIDNEPPIINENKIFKSSIDERLQNLKFEVGDKGTGINTLTIQTLRFANEQLEDTGLNDLEAPKTTIESNDKFSKSDMNLKSTTKINTVEAKGKAKYGRFVSLKFVDEIPENDKYYSIKDGKVTIPAKDFNFKDSYQVETLVYRNGWKGNFEVEVPIYADRSHINISALDYLSNRHNVTIESGFEKNYNYINFINWQSLKDNNMKIFVGEKEVTPTTIIFPTVNENETIKIQYDQDKSHLTELYVRKGKMIDKLVSKSYIVNDNVEKYGTKYDSKNKYIEFTLKEIKSNLEIITTVKDGSMPLISDKKELHLEFKDFDFSKFKSIKVGKYNIDDLLKDSKIKINPGHNQIELRFKDDLNSKLNVDKVIVKSNNKETVLTEGQYFDIIGGKIGYSSSPIGIDINYNFTDDAELIIEFKDTKQSDKDQSKPEKNAITDKNLPNLKLNDESSNLKDKNIKENPYPTIFIKSPSLLSILNHFNVNDDKFVVKGFVGHIDKNDQIASFNAQLVDNYGNPIGKNITLKKEEFKKAHEKYGSLYNGDSLQFSFSVPIVNRFNINLRINLRMESGKEATVTRRFIYDRLTPKIDYIIDNRDLGSGKVNLRIQSQDDSIVLNLFHEDSLIDSIDKSMISYENENGVRLSKELNLDLNYGQNKITISAIDMAKNVVTKEIYIFRTKSDNIIFKGSKVIKKDNLQ